MRRLLFGVAGLLAIIGAMSAHAQIPPPPSASPPGFVRVAGPAAMEALASRWARDFERANPGVHVELMMRGSDVAMAELYTGRADIALMGRDASEPEAKAFEWIFLYPPSRVELMAGSVDQPGRAPALAIIVHPDNPLTSVSMGQLASLFGADPATPDRVRTWGDLGLEGEWSDRAITLYGPEAESGTGRFFRATVLGGSNKMNWAALTEFADPVGREPDRSGRDVAAAVARDSGGMGVSLTGSGQAVSTVPITPIGSDIAVSLTRSTVASGDYPLARRVYAYFNQRPGTERDAETAAFLRHIAGETGRKAVTNQNGYLPLLPSRRDEHR